ncbi:MAG: hypothetical protein HY849_01545 [Nitrosomonadales bacterium]|nr:hypothetical protein [Nitrosomonadales bacterium]
MKNVILISGLALALAGCAADGRNNRAVLGGAVGGAVGAGVGHSVGGQGGAILGGAIGGATGAAIGTSGQQRQPAARPVYQPRDQVRPAREHDDDEGEGRRHRRHGDD